MIHVPLGHKAYHHFLGEGLFDSEIDVVIGRENKFGIEKFENIFCKHEFPFIHSHHDLISSSFTLPKDPLPIPPAVEKAPLIQNTRTKVIWDEASIGD